MSRRSLVTPLIVALLLTVATGLTFSTARSSPEPSAGAARTTVDLTVSGVVVGHGLDSRAEADLAEAFPGWTIEVSRASRRDVTPVVVVALRPEARRWRPYLLRYAADRLPARTTVVFESLDRAGDARRARHTAALLSDDPGRRRG